MSETETDGGEMNEVVTFLNYEPMSPVMSEPEPRLQKICR